MTGIEVSKMIAGIITSAETNLTVKVHPIAPYAPQAYISTESVGVVLIYQDTVKGYNHPKKIVDGSRQKIIDRVSRFVISVGVKSIDTPDVDLKCEIIENLLSYLDLGGDITELLPVGWSRISQDVNGLYWRQMWFETTIRRRIER